jgi:hypothetical protein
MQESSTTSLGESGPTPRSTHLSPRSRGDPYPPDLYKTSSEQTNASTRSSYRSSSTAWSLPSKGKVISTICNACCLKNNERLNYKWGPRQECPPLCSNPSLPHQMGTSKIKGRWPLNSPVAMECDVWPDGSSAWIKDKWPGTLMGTPPLTSLSSSTSTPQSTPGGKMMCLGDSQHGSSLHSWALPPHSPHFAKGSKPFPRTTGNTWLKLTAFGPSTSSASPLWPKSTNSSPRWRCFTSNNNYAKGGWRWAELPSRLNTCIWGSMGPTENMTGYALRPFRQTGVDKDIHSDGGSGVTSLRRSSPLSVWKLAQYVALRSLLFSTIR